jgi:hypothetical protein
MKFIARVRHVGLANETTVAVRVWIDVHDANRVSVSSFQRVDQRDIREPLSR